MTTTNAIAETTREELVNATAAAAGAAGELAARTLQERSRMLDAAADALDAESEQLVPLAVEETSLDTKRLAGELVRTTTQLRMFAELVREGSYLEAVIDTADPAATPPRPDVRRMLHPIGPVAVYSASNFPFAFSVAGGDTASALAAGCPVVVKVHRGHPRLSEQVARIVGEALVDSGAPDGSLSLVHGRTAGEALVVDPRIKAGAFTGSVTGGRALFDRASTEREDPIPFYGELGSINPVIVTTGAARERPDMIAQGLIASFTLGVGQFCTKPGVVLIPADSAIEAHIAEALPSTAGGSMLTESISKAFRSGVTELADHDGVTLVAHGAPSQNEDSKTGTEVSPSVFATTPAGLAESPERLLEECFGPTCLLVRYSDQEELKDIAEMLPGSLTVTIHATDDEKEWVGRLLPRLQELAGRVIWNGWPTGVAVNRSMQHGGPWPSTTGSLHTSVGGTALRRFLRPVAYQDFPDGLLPSALQRTNPLQVLRTVNGELTAEATIGSS